MNRFFRYASPVVGMIILVLAVVGLRKTLHKYHYHDIVQAFQQISNFRIAAALGLTALGYLTLTTYDYLALRYVRQRIPYLKVAMTSFIAYAFAFTIGFSVLSGSSVRYRLYTGWSVTPLRIAKIILFCAVSGWMGFLFLGGLALLLEPAFMFEQLPLPAVAPRPIGVVFLAVVAAYVIASKVLKKRVHVRGIKLSFPSPPIVTAQIVAACFDIAVVGGVLYVLLPHTESMGYFRFMGVFLLAMSMGLLSQVPGGLGVFELITVALLSPSMPADSIVASLLVFRVVYYLIPFVTAIAIFGLHEAHHFKAFLERTTRSTHGLVEPQGADGEDDHAHSRQNGA